MTSGEGPGSGAGVGSQGSLLVTFLDKSDPSLGSRGEGWAGECGAGTPLCVCVGGHRLLLMGICPPPSLCPASILPTRMGEAGIFVEGLRPWAWGLST